MEGCGLALSASQQGLLVGFVNRVRNPDIA
jgi:hypothetical protein